MRKKVGGKSRTKKTENGHFRKFRVCKSTRMRCHVEVVKSIKIVMEEINKTCKALKSRAFYYNINKIIFYIRYYIRCKERKNNICDIMSLIRKERF